MVRSPLIFTLFVAATLVLSTVGILVLVFQRAGLDIVLGILTLIMGAAVLTGGIMAQAAISRQARLVRLQTDFISHVSHELRTPLASIRMFVDTLREGRAPDPADQARCLDIISAETSRLTRIIERLLTWGRMETGRRVFQKRPELVANLVEEAIARADPQLQAHQVHLQLDIQDRGGAVLADREALVESLHNLVANAIKYGTNETSRVIRVRVRRIGKRALVSVEDEGPGIPRREQRRIFEKFYRGTREVDAHTKGSGLGLAMANLVVKAHRGRIRLVSRPGEGSCFTVVLPALADPSGAMEVPPG